MKVDECGEPRARAAVDAVVHSVVPGEVRLHATG
jgi:hypothetical protein